MQFIHAMFMDFVRMIAAVSLAGRTRLLDPRLRNRLPPTVRQRVHYHSDDVHHDNHDGALVPAHLCSGLIRLPCGCH